VNRGWIGTGPNRNVLPDVAAPTQPRTITGRIERLPQPAIRLAPEAADLPASDGVKVLDFPNMARLSGLLGQPLYEYQLLLDPAESDGYVRDWQAPGIPPERNLVYAGQWLLLAVGALGAAVTIGIGSVRRRRP
jgi:surfeit locus 1 family protein